jgi:hypothetical protein
MFSEQDVDRELKAALSVAPSPDFEACVLQRVEADRPSRWPAHYGWLAAAASLVLVASVFYSLNRTPAVVAEPPAPQIVEHPAPRIEMPRHEAPAGTNTSEPPRAQTVRASVVSLPSPRTTEPEVLVSPDQMEAVRRLVRAANEGRFVEAPAEPVPGPMAPPAAVGVTPFVVEPIPLSPLGPGPETATPFVRGVK